jgi:hypothetical protein
MAFSFRRRTASTGRRGAHRHFEQEEEGKLLGLRGTGWCTHCRAIGDRAWPQCG